MTTERDMDAQWGEDPNNDRYAGRSAAFLPTDWSSDLVNKDYVKPKHLNAISKALWSLHGLRHPLHYLADSELTGSVVAPAFFRAVSIFILDSVLSYQKIKIHVAMKDNSDAVTTYGCQDIEWDDALQSVDSGNGAFAFILRYANGASGRTIEIYLPVISSITWSWWTESSANVTVKDALPGDARVSNYQGAISGASGWTGFAVAAGTTGKYFWDDEGNFVIKGAVTSANGIEGGDYAAGNGYKVSRTGFTFSGLYNGVRKVCSLSFLSGGIWRFLIDVIQASSISSTTVSGKTATFSESATVGGIINNGDTVNSGGVLNKGGVINNKDVVNNGDVDTDGTTTNNGVTLLKGNTIQKGTLSSFSQAQSADRVAIATISVPAGAKLLFFERHTIGSSIPHSLGLYTDLSSASPVDTQAYETAGPISLMLGYTNSTDEPVTLYFRFGPISEGQTVSLTNINWNYLFM